MTENEMREHVQHLLAQIPFVHDDLVSVPQALLDHETGVDWVIDARETGLLTENPGVCVRMRDGNEFQIMIIQSRNKN